MNAGPENLFHKMLLIREHVLLMNTLINDIKDLGNILETIPKS